jgi:hypothetical protein
VVPDKSITQLIHRTPVALDEGVERAGLAASARDDELTVVEFRESSAFST